MTTRKIYYPNREHDQSYPEVWVFGAAQDSKQEIRLMDSCLKAGQGCGHDRFQVTDEPAQLFEAWVEANSYNFGTAGYIHLGKRRLGRVTVKSAQLSMGLTPLGQEQTSAALLYTSLLEQDDNTRIRFNVDTSGLQLEGNIWDLGLVGSVREALAERNQWLLQPRVA